ncbi:hypothetical protein GALMADRAFT_148816 [Galerina marginata CBS 339.88]|uniref:Uncharacterized protein n=1 Tax=Galerina marginata (strain CBS 339.88) TaxID=685588 RepID=A0A067S3A0_GALM3|nr:hypothetical protein GALMADRAFT_148816 [Galerina marginata CBS 339.88]
MSHTSLNENDFSAQISQAEQHRDAIRTRMFDRKDEILEARSDQKDCRIRANKLISFFTNILDEMKREVGECAVNDAAWRIPEALYNAEAVGDEGNELQQQILAGFSAKIKELGAVAQLDQLMCEMYAAEEAVRRASILEYGASSRATFNAVNGRHW